MNCERSSFPSVSSERARARWLTGLTYTSAPWEEKPLRLETLCALSFRFETSWSCALWRLGVFAGAVGHVLFGVPRLQHTNDMFREKGGDLLLREHFSTAMFKTH